MMKACILSIGDEILSGSTVDTNSNFIAQKLKSIGIAVSEIRTISDDMEVIKNALQQGFQKNDLIITTGGLGPTRDDKTKMAFVEFFGDELVFDEATFENLRQIFKQRNREHLLELNRPQAEIPKSAHIFLNDYGTAPSLLMQKDGKTAICLPGIPSEMKALMRTKIIPHLKNEHQLNFIISRTLTLVNIPESLLAEKIEAWELALPKNLSLSYLPIGNRIKLKITGLGENGREVKTQISDEVEKLHPLISENVISWNGESITEIFATAVFNSGLTLSTAESCTGGEIAKLITSIPGISPFFKGGIVAYETAKKVEILKVSQQTIDTYSVVSQQVAQEMSEGCRQIFDTDIAISTTGVAGPMSDEDGNEIGTVFYSIRVKDFEITKKLFLPHYERKDFMAFVAQKTLQDLVEILTLGKNR
ncbi:CinA family nicotinamide mononucleotide deamidase-related protein [Cruoricaptor ignavus]|nr:CinA family nicotinamide mononucleotide deamidase-related protein [Cruoricaptor ignavus]